MALKLRVVQPNGQEAFIKDGLRIGRSVANDIELADDERVDQHHAQVHVSEDGVAVLKTTRSGLFIHFGLDSQEELQMRPGLRFLIGRTEIECLNGSGAPTELTRSDSIESWTVDRSRFGNSQHSVPASEASPTLKLCVLRNNRVDEEFYIRDGLRIGRSVANDIELAEDGTVDQHHAQVHISALGSVMLKTTRTGLFLRTEQDLQEELQLQVGTRFSIGGTDFECREGTALPSRPANADYAESCASGQLACGIERTETTEFDTLTHRLCTPCERAATDNVEAINGCRTLSEQNYKHAQFDLGTMYAIGDGVEKDAVETIKWLLNAADQNHADTQYNLGWLYAFGEDLARNPVAALQWWHKAADQNHANAQYALGWVYALGEGGAKNLAEAIKWYRKAADQNHAIAQYNLALMYANGEGIAKNLVEAVTWLRRAADQHLSVAQYLLGKMYANGDGVTKNRREAVQWYLKAADQNHADAQCHLGWVYSNGEGVSKNKIVAVKWYRKAAGQNHANAQHALGWIYANGEGVAANRGEAINWYRKAIANPSVSEDTKQLASMAIEALGSKP